MGERFSSDFSRYLLLAAQPPGCSSPVRQPNELQPMISKQLQVLYQATAITDSTAEASRCSLGLAACPQLCAQCRAFVFCCAVPCLRDRMSVPRGPCPLHVLKDCWVQGVIDENTLVWGQVRGAACRWWGVWGGNRAC